MSSPAEEFSRPRKVLASPVSRAKPALGVGCNGLLNLSNLLRARLRSALGARVQVTLQGNFRVRENVQACTFARESRP